MIGRGHGGGGGSAAGASTEARVLATFLTEMDGIGSVGGSELGADVAFDCGVIVLAATNRIKSIDAALLRKVN